MANRKHPFSQLLLLSLFCAAVLVEDATCSEVQMPLNNRLKVAGHLKDGSKGSLIGSVAPTCTYNECRGCKYKCTAEQVPVVGNDPVNSPYRYKCVCHR